MLVDLKNLVAMVHRSVADTDLGGPRSWGAGRLGGWRWLSKRSSYCDLGNHGISMNLGAYARGSPEPDETGHLRPKTLTPCQEDRATGTTTPTSLSGAGDAAEINLTVPNACRACGTASP